MSALLLARLQFALTICFHFLFPAMTLGTALIILISETLYLIKKDETYKRINGFSGEAAGKYRKGFPNLSCYTGFSGKILFRLNENNMNRLHHLKLPRRLLLFISYPILSCRISEEELIHKMFDH